MSNKISQEDFEQWRDNPVTLWVFGLLQDIGEKAKHEWLSASWGSGRVDPVLLADLKARADTIKQLTEAEYGDLTENEQSRTEG